MYRVYIAILITTTFKDTPFGTSSLLRPSFLATNTIDSLSPTNRYMTNSSRSQFYHDVFAWVLRQQQQARSTPLMVGLSAPQGAGKTTLTAALCEIAAAHGIRAVSLSIDDFYLTRAEQLRLARAHPNNPYWQQRGYPGTHDLALGEATLHALKGLGSKGALPLPAYDKSAHSGQGDRRPMSEWREVRGPLEVIFVEGWMLGFTAVPDSELNDASLKAINAALPAYERWLELLDAFIWLEPLDLHYTVDWRVEAEERMKEQGKTGMSQPEILAYIAKFLPAYKTYLPVLKATVSRFPHLHLTIARNRLPKSNV